MVWPTALTEWYLDLTYWFSADLCLRLVITSSSRIGTLATTTLRRGRVRGGPIREVQSTLCKHMYSLEYTSMHMHTHTCS